MCGAFALSACNNAKEDRGASSEQTIKSDGKGGEMEEEEKSVKFDAFEEAITSKVNALKIVQDETRRVDSLSNGSRHLEYRVVKDRGRAHVYTVRVFEPTGKDTLDHFRFHVDSLTGNILNRDGRH